MPQAFPETFHPALPGGHTITRSSSPVMECPLKFSAQLSESIEARHKDFLTRQQISLQEVSRSKNLKKRSRKRNARTKADNKRQSSCVYDLRRPVIHLIACLNTLP